MGFEHMTPEKRRETGLKGGLKTKERKLAENPHYYEELGRSGGHKRVEKAGGLEKFRKVASDMGKRGGRINAKNRWGMEDEQ